MPEIIRAEEFYREARLPDGRVRVPPADAPICDWAYLLYPPAVAPPLPRRGELDSSIETPARIDHGRWVADCPFCPGAQIVTPTDPRFLCAGLDGCANVPVAGAYVRVIFPDQKTVGHIEAALRARPAIHAHWLPGEPVALLEAGG
jgi:hypothetical protein